MEIEDVFRAYYDARRNKRNTSTQLRFEINLEENLVKLYEEIRDRKYKVGKSICFIVTDPVKREVFAASFRDRVVHHLLFNFIAPSLDKQFIDDSYSCRKEKGTLYGVNRLEHHIRSCSNNYQKPCYVLKMDIKGYFMSIDRQILFNILLNRLKANECTDWDLVVYLSRIIIFNDPTSNCYIKGKKEDWIGLPPSKSLFHSAHGKGLPIGNLTSQLFSNVYLSLLDDYVKRVLKQKHYGRYVDDFYIVNESKETLRLLIPIIADYLRNSLKLTLHPQKIYLQPVVNGVPFIGAYLKPYRRYPVDRTFKKIKRGMKQLKETTALIKPIEKVSEKGRHRNRYYTNDLKPLQAVVNSYLGYLGHFNTYNYRVLFSQINGWLFDYGCFGARYAKLILYSKHCYPRNFYLMRHKPAFAPSRGGFYSSSANRRGLGV